MVDLLKSPIRFLRTFWHRMAGKVCFRLRRQERARRHFEQVLLLKGDDFAAYFYLARLAFSAGDMIGYHRELAHARRTSPERLARIRYLFDYFEPTPADDSLFADTGEQTGERATWRAFRMSSVGGNDPAPGERGLTSCPGGDLRRYGDDFSSPQERERFSDLPAISLDDLAEVDLDTLSESL
jgi:hypothetical protein